MNILIDLSYYHHLFAEIDSRINNHEILYEMFFKPWIGQQFLVTALLKAVDLNGMAWAQWQESTFSIPSALSSGCGGNELSTPDVFTLIPSPDTGPHNVDDNRKMLCVVTYVCTDGILCCGDDGDCSMKHSCVLQWTLWAQFTVYGIQVTIIIIAVVFFHPSHPSFSRKAWMDIKEKSKMSEVGDPWIARFQEELTQ